MRRNRKGWRCSHRKRGATRLRDQNLPDMTDVEVAWVAGLLEGEGSFSERGVQVNMTDRDVLERLARICGGNVNGPYEYRDRPTSKPFYRWTAGRVVARQLMRRILPLMGERRRERILELV